MRFNGRSQFKFDDGQIMDYSICGIEVDCKYSQTIGGWMIPIEAMGHLCIVVSASDVDSAWSLGVVRIVDAILTKGGNRDQKRSITADGRKSIHWVFENAELTPNILLKLPRKTVDGIMSLASGNKRVDEIFRVAPGKRIGRGVIETLGPPGDPMKRLRNNGGSRSSLRPEGFIILGHYAEHKRIAQELSLPVPLRGEVVGVRVVPADDSDPVKTRIGDSLWRVALDSEHASMAPECPHLSS